MSTFNIDERTREEWRDLGFYYDFDDVIKCWTLFGSRSGLSNFCKLLEKYTSNPKHSMLGEHDHFGPYMYLKVTTWSEPLIAKEAIMGSLQELKRLSKQIEDKLASAKMGDIFQIDEEYSKENEATIVINIMSDEFDPSSLDNLLSKED